MNTVEMIVILYKIRIMKGKGKGPKQKCRISLEIVAFIVIIPFISTSSGDQRACFSDVHTC